MHGEKKTVLYRYGAVVTALLMLLAVFVLPVMPMNKVNAGYESVSSNNNGISVTLQPGYITADTNFSVYINIKKFGENSTYISGVYNGAEVTVTGVNGIQNSFKGTIEGSKEDGYYIYIPAGTLTYDGKDRNGRPQIEINITGQSNVYYYTLSSQEYGVTREESSGTSEPSEPAAPDLIGKQITVAENAFMPEIEAGQTKTITIPLEATRVVRNAQVTLAMPEGLYLNSASATQSVSFGSGRKASISYEVTARSDVTDSVVPITLTSVYEYDDKQVSEETTFSVRLKAKQTIESTGGLVITGYTLGDQILKYGGNTTLTINIQNTSDQMMKDIVMELGGLTAQQITVRNGMDVQRLVELAPGASSSFTYDLHADETVTDGTAILTATVSCGTASSGGSGDTSDGTGGAVSSAESTAKIFVPCAGKPEESSGGEGGEGSTLTPQVIIESYSYGEEPSVVGGSTFTLTMTLRNTSATTAIENVKMVVSSAADETTGGVFTPANSSNSFYIDRVAPGGTFTESIDLTVKADASPKSYGVDIALDFQAKEGSNYQDLKSTETITIPVTQPDRFEVEDVQISDYNYVGDSIYCSVSYVNMGKNPIYNLTISVEGTGFSTAEPSAYIGNVEAGSGDYYEPSLTADMAGPVEGKIILTYEDAAGNQSTVERPFSTTVQEMMVDPGIDMPVEPVVEETGLPLAGKIAIGAGAGVVVIVVVVVVLKLRKKRRRKAVPDFDEDDEDNVDFEDDDDDRY